MIQWVNDHLVLTIAIAAAILRGIGSLEAVLRIQVIASIVLLSGFLMLQGASLAAAAWTVPLVHLVQFLLLLAVIRKNLELSISDILHSFRGAIVLSVAGLCVAALVHGSSQATSIGMGVVPLLAGCCAIVLLIVFRFTWFFSMIYLLI